MKIETQIGLMDFLTELKICNIEIPENVTLEIDSKSLKEEIEGSIKELHGISVEMPISFIRGKFTGTKISIKPTEK